MLCLVTLLWTSNYIQHFIHIVVNYFLEVLLCLFCLWDDIFKTNLLAANHLLIQEGTRSATVKIKIFTWNYDTSDISKYCGFLSSILLLDEDTFIYRSKGLAAWTPCFTLPQFEKKFFAALDDFFTFVFHL
jgi:hypothetical protein